MIRFIRELRYFIEQVCWDYPRQRDEEDFANRWERLLGYTFDRYTMEEIFTEVSTWHVPDHWVGKLVKLIYARTNRGKTPIRQAGKLFRWRYHQIKKARQSEN